MTKPALMFLGRPNGFKAPDAGYVRGWVCLGELEEPFWSSTSIWSIEQVLSVAAFNFRRAWKQHDLKNPAKGLAVQLGGQWFWYQEGIDGIREILTAVRGGGRAR